MAICFQQEIQITDLFTGGIGSERLIRGYGTDQQEKTNNRQPKIEEEKL
jgi:hypothetical protein